MIFQIFWFPSAKIISVDSFHVPSVPVSIMMPLGFLFIYVIKCVNKSRAVAFPFMIPLILLTVSHFVSSFTALAGFSDEFPRAIGFALSSFIEVWLIWRTIENNKDFLTVYKGATIAFFVACLYGLIEYLLKDNLFVRYKFSLTAEGLHPYLIDLFRGYRLTSVFEHPIGAGMSFGLFFVLFFILWFQYGKKTPYRWFGMLTAMLSLLCMLLTKMRSCMLFTIIASFAFINFRKKQTYIFIFSSIIILALTFPLYKQKFDIFLSIFSNAAQTKVGGSSLDMRLTQLDAVIDIMKMSFWTGFGDRVMDYINSAMLVGAYQLESIWFETMAKYGMLGVMSTIVLLIYSTICIPKKYLSRRVFFIALAFWVTSTLTSTPFFRMNLYYIVLFYCIKQTDIYKEAKECNRIILLPKT
jgi:hypothetical protein